MVEARIVSPSSSLYFAGHATAHDVHALRAHVRDVALDGCDVRLDVSASDAEWSRLVASGWLDQLARAGASVRRCPAPAPSRRACA